MFRILFFTFFCIVSSPGFAATILIHGDSLSAGYGIESGKEWASLLKQQLPQHTIINSSISGETSQGGLKRLPALLEKYQPDIVLLELGANDGLRGQSLSQMRDNLSQMIELSQAHGQVLLIGVRIPPNYGTRYTEAFHNTYDELARHYQLAYVPFFLEGIAGNSDLMQKDRLHPNESAQSLLLKNIDKSLNALLQPQH